MSGVMSNIKKTCVSKYKPLAVFGFFSVAAVVGSALGFSYIKTERDNLGNQLETTFLPGTNTSCAAMMNNSLVNYISSGHPSYGYYRYCGDIQNVNFILQCLSLCNEYASDNYAGGALVAALMFSAIILVCIGPIYFHDLYQKASQLEPIPESANGYELHSINFHKPVNNEQPAPQSMIDEKDEVDEPDTDSDISRGESDVDSVLNLRTGDNFNANNRLSL